MNLKKLTEIDYPFTDTQLKSLERKKFIYVEDFLRNLPKKYHDYSETVSLLPFYEDKDVAVKGTLKSLSREKVNGRWMVKAEVQETATGTILHISWIGMFFIYDELKEWRNKEIFIGGKLQYFERAKYFSMLNPYVITDDLQCYQKVLPEYSSMKGFTEDEMKALVNKCLSEYKEEDFLDSELREKYNQPEIEKAIWDIHVPSSLKDAVKGIKRLEFDDLVYFSSKIEENSRSLPKGSAYGIKTIKNTIDFVSQFPYELTPDQKEIYDTVLKNIKEGKRINALVQGDVGSGKTVVAFICMFMMADNGYQSVLMAPTNVLALQHYEELSSYAEKYGYKVAYIGSKQTQKEKREIYKKIKEGYYQFIVGTQGVISSKIEYNNLAMMITDEEHRFGVLQRDALIEKANTGVHTITMSATPIPRTVASALYKGNLDIYTIKTKPKGRQPVKTTIFNKEKGIFQFIKNQIEAGYQAYVICPLIEHSKDDSKMTKIESVDNVYKKYKTYFSENKVIVDGIEKEVQVAVVNGKMKQEETKEIIKKFKENEYQILISTTVIEVGVNVPNANVIVISNAERFGLASLHQLRGRVGRGKTQAYCILKSECIDNPDLKENKKSFERLNVLCESNDGFHIALMDLKQRGTGDILGTRQAGKNEYIDLMLENQELYNSIREDVDKMCDDGRISPFIEHYKNVNNIIDEE